MKKTLIFLFTGLSLYFLSCISNSEKEQQHAAEKVSIYYLQTIAETETLVKQLIANVEADNKEKEWKSLFLTARLAFKKGEFLTAYYTPISNKVINGAPIPMQDEDDQHRLVQPEGFQVVEAHLFPQYDKNNKAELLRELRILLANLKHLKQMGETQELANAQIVDALKLEVFRVITLGISGFDAPIAQNSVAEASAALEGLAKVTALYQEDFPESKNLQTLAKKLISAQAYLQQPSDFNNFDRATFIKKYANPISAQIEIIKKDLAVQPIPGKRFLAENASTLFAKGIFDADYFTSTAAAASNPAKVKLGAYLFFDPILSGNGQRTCASCHQPNKAFTDGMVKSLSFTGKTTIKRNTPTVLNAGFQYGQFYDHRVLYLEDQATDVISNQDEMHGKLDNALLKLQKSEAYDDLFKKAFAEDKNPINSFNLRNALGSYIRSLESFDAPFDKYMRGDETQLNQQELHGFNLFMGKAKCGTCHFTPLFNGTVPPDYANAEVEIIGVPVKPKVQKVDPDKGRYAIRNIKLHEFAFKVPSLRNIALTAPYMHNGAFNTLEEVMDFYNDGGGKGLNLHLENQTLPFDQLNLTTQEKNDIIAFMQKLSDDSAKKSIPTALPALQGKGITRNLRTY